MDRNDGQPCQQVSARHDRHQHRRRPGDAADAAPDDEERQQRCERSRQHRRKGQGLAQGGETGVTGVIDEIRTAVIEGNSWYYFRLIGEDCFYAVSAGQCESAIILSVGDKVLIQDAAAEGEIRQAGSIRKD